MTSGGSTNGGPDPGDETRTDVPTTPPLPGSPPPPGSTPPATPPSGPPPSAPQAPPAAPAPWVPPYAGAGAAGTNWAPAPGGGGQYAVPGAPDLKFGGALPRFVAYLIDSILLGLLTGILFAALVGFVPSLGRVPFLSAVLGVAIDAAYFVGLWRTGAHATLGMRLLNLQVGNAFDGHTLDLNQAVRRWVALGGWLSAFGYSASTSGISGTLLLLWSIVLLISTVTSPTKQGLHDRFANSAVVAPASGSTGGIALACVLIIGAMVVIALIAIVALIFVGDQVANILSAVGESV